MKQLRTRINEGQSARDIIDEDFGTIVVNGAKSGFAKDLEWWTKLLYMLDELYKIAGEEGYKSCEKINIPHPITPPSKIPSDPQCQLKFICKYFEEEQ